MNLSKSEIEILKLLASEDEVNVKDLSEHLGTGIDEMYQTVEILSNHGLVNFTDTLGRTGQGIVEISSKGRMKLREM